MTPDAKSLILDLLTSVRGHAMPVQALVAAGAIFAIRPETIRVALVRLGEAGKIARRERGQYGIAPAARAVHQHVVSWDRIEERLVPWRGGWIGVHSAVVTRRDRVQERRRLQGLAFLGVREWRPGLWVRPDNLRAGVEGVRMELAALGLDAGTPVFAIQQCDAPMIAGLVRLWEIAALRRLYRTTQATLARSASRLGGLSMEEAMIESYRCGGEAIRTIVLDPLLPEPLIPARERRVLLEAMRRYDRLGRTCWRVFMRSHGAPHRQVGATITDATRDHTGAARLPLEDAYVANP